MAKFKVIPQPPINRFARRDGRSRPWLAGVLVVVGLGLLAAGLLRTHRTAGGGRMSEPNLVELVTRSGVHRAPATATAPTTQESGPPVLQPVEKPPEACPT